MSKVLSVNIQNIRGISNLKINLSLSPDVYAITGVNGIGKSTLLTCITPRLHRPTSFEVLRGVATNESSIEYTIGDETEIWEYDGSQWKCTGNITSPLRGFQEGSLSNGTRFLNITSMGYRYYKQMLNIRSELLTEADSFVKESLGIILQNDKNYYSNLYRLDRSKAERYYKYKGVVYYLKIADKYIPQFELSNGEFLLINLLHLLNNLLVRNNNSEKLNLILIDEIELALHPSAIKRLVQFVKVIAKKYQVAIYFSTHSIEIINSLPIENLFYLHKSVGTNVICETPCYPAYITRDIYTHSGYDVLILVEDDLAQYFVSKVIRNKRIDNNKRIQVLPVGGYDNTLELHQNLLREEILGPIAHILSVIDGDVETAVFKKRIDDGKWLCIPEDSLLFLPIESVEKYLKSELIDKKNYELMRLIRDRLFKFESEINWFESEYNNNIDNQIEKDRSKGIEIKSRNEYFSNGKNLFSVLSSKYEQEGKSKVEFRKNITELVIEYFDSTAFEEKVFEILTSIFNKNQ